MGASYPILATSIVIGRYVYWHEGWQEEGDILGYHAHGAGRFLILSRDGQIEPNLVWKDTVLLRAGETAEILLYVTNPGLWMAHCHIAEHTEGGMMFSFDVAPSPEG
jgi:Multicopper oxidase